MWYITSSCNRLNSTYIGDVEYHNERYFYLFQFIDSKPEDTLLFSYMKSFPVIELEDDMYIFLTNEPIKNYNHKTEMINVDGEDDLDILGGNIVYANLE